MPNLSPLLYSTNEHPTFLKELDLSNSEKQSINSARADVRDALRSKLPGALRDRGYQGKDCNPKFFIQGSWAYKTLNRPCQTPPQQSDVDDGVRFEDITPLLLPEPLSERAMLMRLDGAVLFFENATFSAGGRQCVTFGMMKLKRLPGPCSVPPPSPVTGLCT